MTVENHIYSAGLKKAVEHFQHGGYYYKEDIFRDSDVFLAAYPRSGNHFVQFFIFNIFYYQKYGRFCTSLTRLGQIPDIHRNELSRARTVPRVIKTHYPFDPRYRNIIHLVRDPRDIIVSYFHFSQGAPGLFFTKNNINIGLEEFVDLFISGELWPCCIREHTESYILNSDKVNYLLIKYEGLVSNPLTEFSKIVEFLKLDVRDSVLEGLVEHTKFSNMSKLATKRGGKIYRKGIIGSHKSELDKKSLEKIEKEFTGYPWYF